MKIIHTADIHLGSKLESKFTKEISTLRKKEVLSTFNRMVNYAKENDIKIILLSGDIFDSDKPALKDKEFFYSLVKDNPDIEFLYLNGNHDKSGSYVENFDNLKTFDSNTFKSYEYDDVVISGIELDEANYSTFYSKLVLDKTKKNIVMLHGETSSSLGVNKIKLDNLKDKGIDYLALGHIHSFKSEKIDDRGISVYPGILEGRGFDETGEKGFVVLDIGDSINYKFIPFASRTINEIDVDITGSKDLYEIETKVSKSLKDISKNDILRINLVGDIDSLVDFDETDIKVFLESDKYFFVDVKNKTKEIIDVTDYENDNSLVGEFIRGVNSNTEYTEEEKHKLINLGLRVINGKEIE